MSQNKFGVSRGTEFLEQLEMAFKRFDGWIEVDQNGMKKIGIKQTVILETYETLDYNFLNSYIDKQNGGVE